LIAGYGNALLPPCGGRLVLVSAESVPLPESDGSVWPLPSVDTSSHSSRSILGGLMSNVIYLHALRPRALDATYALKEVKHLLDLCREVELRARWLTREQGISIGQRLDPELIPKVESLVRTLRRPS
jgi:hypothetical protein